MSIKNFATINVYSKIRTCLFKTIFLIKLYSRMLHRIVSPRLRVCLSRSFFISPSNSLLKIQQRKNSHNEEKSEQIPDSFFSDCWKLTKTIFPIALAIFIVKQIFFVPIIGRSMCPQFNPGVADYGDTVLFVPRLFRATPLVRGNIYLFTDPSNR